MTRWCRIEGERVAWGPGALPRNHDNTSNFHLLPPGELHARGWRPYRLVATATPGQIVTGSSIAITEAEVVETQIARDPTPEEIAERERADVPAEVALWRFRAACRVAGVMAQVEAAIDALPDPPRAIAREAWEYGKTVERDHPFVKLIATTCALDARGLDDLFRSAVSIGT